MNIGQTMLRSAIVSALGAAGATSLIPAAAQAVTIADGNYLAVINTTPCVGDICDFGSDGAWNSSLSFGVAAPGSNSQKITDNSANISTPSGTRGSSMLGNGAGSFNISLVGGSFTATGFQVDAILTTPGGTFVQYGSITGGTVTGTGGMTLDVTGRLAAFSGNFPSPGSMHDERWNVDDFTTPGNTAWRTFTTGASGNTDTAANSTNPGSNTAGLGFLNAGAISGAEAVSLGDINSDGLTDYRIILVSAGHMGADWGCCFGASYLEAWNINLVSQVTAVPIPAAAWLFGSGLLGLATLVRRKRH